MPSASSFLCVLLAIAALSLPTAEARRLSGRDDDDSNDDGDGPRSRAPRAVYFQTNDLVSNSVAAVKFDALTGMLASDVTLTPTGGQGGAGSNGTAPVPADPLFSQSAVTVGDGYLFAVNAGSNTLSMFKIDESDPTRLTLLGTPASTLGDFPVSVAYSSKLNTACVVNAGSMDGVTCFKATGRGLVSLDTAVRPFNLGKTTPPVGPAGTVSQVLFNPESTALFVPVKGFPGTSNTGFLAAFPVSRGRVTRTYVKSSGFPSSALLFGSAFAGNDRLVVSDPSPGVVGAVTLSINGQFEASELAVTHAVGSRAICWAAYSDRSRTAFLADAGSGKVVELDPFANGVPIIGSATAQVAGQLDMAVGGDYLFALAPRSGAISVYDISGGIATKQTLASAAVVIGAMGMAVQC